MSHTTKLLQEALIRCKPRRDKDGDIPKWQMPMGVWACGFMGVSVLAS